MTTHTVRYAEAEAMITGKMANYMTLYMYTLRLIIGTVPDCLLVFIWFFPFKIHADLQQ